MKKLLTILTLVAFCVAQQGLAQSMSDQSMQDSSQESSQNSFDQSSQNSTQQSSDSEASSEATADGSRNSEPSGVALITVGALVSIAITVGGILLTVHVSQAEEEAVLRLQDQIYAGDGKDYRELLAFFELQDRDLVAANDELVAAGYRIDSDQQAADYLAALILALTKKSGKLKAQLAIL